MYLDWSQPFELQYRVTTWLQVEMSVEYLQTRGGDSVDNMQWNLVVKPDATVDRFLYQISASLKSMSNKTIADNFNSFAVAIADNRPNVSERLE